MKKIYQLFIASVMFFAISSCESRNYKQEIDQACEEADFSKAYAISEEAHQNYDGNYHDYIIDKEALFLISQNNEECTKRFAYLIKEETFSHDNLKKYLQLAIDSDNDFLVETIVPDLIKEIDLEHLDRNEDEEELILQIFDYCTQHHLIKPVMYIYNKFETSEYTFSGLHSGLYYKKKPSVALLSALMSFNDSQSNNIIKDVILRLSSSLSVAHRNPQKHCCFSVDYDYKHYNSICGVVMASAISERNKTIAKFVCSNAKPLCEIKYLPDGNTHYYVLHNENVKELQRMFNEADFDD